METLGRAGNTIYLFGEDGNGMSFSSSGRFIASVPMKTASLVLRSTMPVNVISLLGKAGENRCDLYFNGEAGIVNYGYEKLIAGIVGLGNAGVIPLRVSRCEEPGLMQVLSVVKPGSISKGFLSEKFGVTNWRKL
jgi:hypothetical protein